MADEPTLGEVVRRLEDIRQDLKDDVRELGSRLDSKVSMERYLLEQAARDDALKLLVERVKGVEDARAEELRQRELDRRTLEDRRRADRRLVFTALVAPVLMLLLQVLIASRGASA